MRRSLPVVALLLALALAACDRGGRPGQRQSPTPPPSSTASTPSVAPASTDCTLVIGFSVTEDWYRVGSFETQPGIDDAAWEVLAFGGHDVETWSNPATSAFSHPPDSPCGREPDRIVFQVASARWRAETTEQIVSALRTAVANFQATWPTAEVIELIPIVGGPDGQPCPFTDARGTGVVDASAMNPVMNDVIAEVANGSDVVVGPDPLLADCAQYADVRGHLTVDGSQYVASELAQHYAT